MSNKMFIHCNKCNKRLIERLPNGLFKFMFGKKQDDESPPVEILIHGSLKMRCLSRSCKAWNILTFFPTVNKLEETENMGEINKDKDFIKI